jgi:hypothetical protein
MVRRASLMLTLPISRTELATAFYNKYVYVGDYTGGFHVAGVTGQEQGTLAEIVESFGRIKSLGE